MSVIHPPVLAVGDDGVAGVIVATADLQRRRAHAIRRERKGDQNCSRNFHVSSGTQLFDVDCGEGV